MSKILAATVDFEGKIDLDKTKRPDGEGYYARILDPDGNIIGIWSVK